MLNGILNIYKEKGWTSFDVVGKLRRITGQKKIGHTGTLDPEAEGVLVVCLGNATKIVSLITDYDKTYEATLLLGKTSDTLDATGKILSESTAIPEKKAIVEAIHSFEGEIEQIPPMYSAIRVNGKHLYELARAGKEVERKSRRVSIHKTEILQVMSPYARFYVTCSKGTYIRTLCADIGNKLGCGGLMADLKRTKVGPFGLDTCISIDEAASLMEEGMLKERLLKTDEVFKDLPSLNFYESAAKRADNGNALFPVDIKQADLLKDGLSYRIYDKDGRFYGLYNYNASKELLKLDKFFKENE